jgi:hypothetical protein
MSHRSSRMSALNAYLDAIDALVARIRERQ